MLTWALKKILGTSHEREIKKLKPLIEEINKLEPSLAKLTDAEVRAKTFEMKEKLDNGASLDDILANAWSHDMRMRVGFVRMNADRRPDIGLALGEPCLEAPPLRRPDAVDVEARDPHRGILSAVSRPRCQAPE